MKSNVHISKRIAELNERFKTECGISIINISKTPGTGRFLVRNNVNISYHSEEDGQIKLDQIDQKYYRPDGFYGNCFGNMFEGTLCGATDCRTCGPLYSLEYEW